MRKRKPYVDPLKWIADDVKSAYGKLKERKPVYGYSKAAQISKEYRLHKAKKENSDE